MPRPQKGGVDYFPLDTVLDEKVELIEAEFGLTGFAVVVKLLQYVYQRGYYCEWTKEVALLFARRNALGGNAVSEIVSASIKRGIFDGELYAKYQILTSRGIQKRYFEIVSRRKSVTVVSQYLLVEVAPNDNHVYINPENVYINPQNVCNNSQSKVKESKGYKEEENAREDWIDDWHQNIGILAPATIEALNPYVGMGSDIISFAISEAVDNNARKPRYIISVLDDWKKHGVHTVDDARARTAEHRRKKEPSARTPAKSFSDIVRERNTHDD